MSSITVMSEKGMWVAPDSEKKLRRLFRTLPKVEQETLLSFAEFLASRVAAMPVIATEPLNIPRPAEESVVKAIKRLTATYPMIDRDKLLNQTSSLMAAHVMQGRTASDVIDELELLFVEQYRLWLSHLNQTP